MKEFDKEKWDHYMDVVWSYTKYQLLTKMLLFFVVFPIFQYLLDLLMQSAGRESISSGDYLSFLFSLQGAGLLLMSFSFLALLIGMDINAFIAMSALIQEGRLQMTARDLLSVAMSSLKSLMKPSGVIIMLYVAFITPLVGVGLGVSVLEQFKIPNFITDVIYSDPTYSVIYYTVLAIFTMVSIIHIFFFHYLVIEKLPPFEALKESRQLMRRHWQAFVVDFFGKTILVSIGIIAGLRFIVPFVLNFIQWLPGEFLSRFISLLFTLTVAEVLTFLGLMTVPFICYRLTLLFYRYHNQEGHSVHFDMKVNPDYTFDTFMPRWDNWLDSHALSLERIIGVLLGFNLLISLFMGTYFEEIFKVDHEIAIVAHRGGGDLAAENSILGMEKAAELGATWSEIDVQRTKDNHYIINHDNTLRRVAGVNKSSSELTLDEIKQLKIMDLFNPNRPSQPIATLEEFLDAAKGKIGLLIELKGPTANRQMVDDVVKMIKDKGMEEETALLSLDYSLIQYASTHYPNIKTGYLYFFSIGRTSSLVSDYLIMEEEEATSEKIDAIRKADKKSIVWTVNTESSIKRFTLSQVDGIITDRVAKVQEGMKQRDERTDVEIILDAFLGSF
ncbi:hypothetical protein CJ205_05565 [Dolosicoccus paucivorans]|uniref:GP-PDE domain-containing protein n=1 Tax=Dolosicoccus paucivorans TaxID=84521 RepID=A0A2N6SMB1_9LACT|nr:glycerophosphoryl diester phosphodiesterase membrane domain-containing protein [Dolosicoccus paucivorans]PMB84771.1 hypothetical protein CJ206_01790 [Dolosicoccus paucivorans]PMC58203.1 hypothetical protein CJ205_05565 [Dolosicoccus paucivorans]